LIELLKSKDFYLLFLLYFISNFFFLLNTDAVYWDGWISYNQDDTTLKLLFEQIQHGIKGDFFLFFSHMCNGIYGFRVFVFLSSFINGVLIYLILKNIKELNKTNLFFLTLLFLVIPVASGKISISIIPFLFPVFLFYISFYLLTLYLKRPIFIFRLMLLALFFVSFSTNSVLVFYFSIFIYIYYYKFGLEYDQLWNKIKNIIIEYWDFLLLPFIYFIYKAIYLKPYGLYAGYNKMSILNIFDAIKIVFLNFDNSFVEVVFKSLYTLSFFWIIAFIGIYFIVKKSKNTFIVKNHKVFFLLGILLFILAVFPYAMVGKNSELESWNSRFQILTPLGLSFLIYFGLTYLKQLTNFNEKTFLALTWLLLFSFIGKNISDQYLQLKDYLFTVSIEENIKDNETIRSNTTFIVNNNITDSLFYNRTPIYYELNGIFKKSFGDETRLAIRYDHYQNNIDNISNLKSHKQYNFSSWKREQPLLVTISHNYKVRFGQDEFIRMIAYNLYDKQKFLEMAKQLVYITVEELPKEENDN
jgi:hypothetical protein